MIDTRPSPMVSAPLFKNRMLLATFGLFAVPAVSSAVTYTPSQIRTAYGFNQVTQDGTGQTISIIDFGNDTSVASDLAQFDSHYGLAAGNLTVIDNSAGTTATGSFLLETSLDIQAAHAIAPGANIVLIELPTDATFSDVTAAANTAATKGAVVSMSFGSEGSVGSSAGTYDTAFNHVGVTYVASSGDSGSLAYPSSSPYVVSVGGTNLQTNSNGSYKGETVWNNYVPASGNTPASGGSSGGGADPAEPIPAYQVGVATGPYRSTPDVAYDADPDTGVSAYVAGTLTNNIGGTSAGAPQWAALIALADQERVADGLSTLSSTQALTMLYSAYSNPMLYPELFHDVTSGTNQTGLSAGVGYDDVTGLGTPIANNVVTYLATGVVPEPASLGVLGIASLILVRRRKTV